MICSARTKHFSPAPPGNWCPSFMSTSERLATVAPDRSPNGSCRRFAEKHTRATTDRRPSSLDFRPCEGRPKTKDQGLAYTYSSIGGQIQIKLRSPYGLSILPTGGQNLFARTKGNGNAACSREYGCVQSSDDTAAAVCGAFFST